MNCSNFKRVIIPSSLSVAIITSTWHCTFK